MDFPVAEIDLSAIAHNVRELRRITNKNARLMAVVKANGYGHGMIEVARTALENGADFLGVARVAEAIRIRRHGINAPILVFGITSPDQVPDLLKYHLAQTVPSLAYARELSGKAAEIGKNLKIHMKIDTGMGRLGFPAQLCNESGDAPISSAGIEEALAVLDLPGLSVQGIFTHFATSDEKDKTFANRQFSRFRQVLQQLGKKGEAIELKHAANSGAVIDLPHTHLDMVRPGISIYGLYPSRDVDRKKLNLRPAMTLKTRIVQLKTVSENFPVSYGCTYRTRKRTIIATVAMGYGDGYNRLFSNRGNMLVRGIRAPIIGRVCMDTTMLDVTHIDGVRLFDEVIVFGKSGENVLPVEELAETIDTINYEVVTVVTDRVSREYKPIE